MHRKVTEDTLRDLDSLGIPRIYVYNKSDLRGEGLTSLNKDGSDSVYVSARTGYGIDALLDALQGIFQSGSREVEVLISYAEGHLLDRIHREAEITSESYEENGIHIAALCPAPLADILEKGVVRFSAEG